MMKIAVLPEGSVSDESIRHFLAGQSYELVHFKLMADLIMSTANGSTDYSVVPIENTIEGSVTAHLDFLIHEVDIPIQAEWVYPSIQNLIGYPSPDGEGAFAHIEKVFTIPVAYSQCLQFLKNELPNAELEPTSSTAEGVRIVQRERNQGWAAIGTALAAERYGMTILKHNITDHQNNFTKFTLVGPKPLEAFKPAEQQKTSILITLPEDYPGALHQVLSAFAWRRINLTRIESRPTKKKLGSYYFYIEIEESLDTVLLPGALSEIEAIGCQVRILGSYPSYSYQATHSEV